MSNARKHWYVRHQASEDGPLIKRSDLQVARETALTFNPAVSIDALHANIKDAQFDVEWFSQFAIVLNALDNLEARRHVNKMCMAANVPLIESGTAGYRGQVQPIKQVRPPSRRQSQ